jgi:hypothetical protein
VVKRIVVFLPLLCSLGIVVYNLNGEYAIRSRKAEKLMLRLKKDNCITSLSNQYEAVVARAIRA